MATTMEIEMPAIRFHCSSKVYEQLKRAAIHVVAFIPRIKNDLFTRSQSGWRSRSMTQPKILTLLWDKRWPMIVKTGPAEGGGEVRNPTVKGVEKAGKKWKEEEWMAIDWPK